MKQVTIILFLFSFCISQFQLIEVFAKSKFQSVIENINDETTPEDAKEEIEKEVEDFTSTRNKHLLKGNSLAQLNSNFSFVNLMYTQPFTQKDIKPPRLV